MDFKGKCFFITGGAGFIGSNLAERLVFSDAEVIVYDNLSSGKREFISKLEKQDNFRFIKADLLKMETLEEKIKEAEPDVMIHLAANPNVRLGIEQTDLDLKQNLIATYNVLESCRKHDLKDILFSSSSVVYGVPRVRPTPEEYGPLKPISLYGASKLASEGFITAFSHLFGFRYYIYRFANVAGKNYSHGIMIDLINRLKSNKRELTVLGDGRQKKSYIDVGDCIEGMLHVYEKSKGDENIYNISTDDQTSVKEIAEMVVDYVAKDAEIKYTGTKQGWKGDVADTFVSNGKLRKLGWKPKYNSHRAVERTIDMLTR